MELLRVELSASAPGWVRATGWVRSPVGTEPEPIWYEVEERHAGSLATSGDPWLACGLPLAVTHGVPFVSRVPIDPLLVDNARERMEIWHTWDRRRPIVAVEADIAVTPPGDERNAAFFSGGIDSYATVLPERAAPLDDLLLLHGARDLPLEEPAGFERTRTRLEHIARELGMELVVMRTNIFATCVAKTDRNRMSFGSIMGSNALALGRRWSNVLVPASLDLRWMGPFGVHPLTTPLLSTSHTRLTEDGVGLGRFAKTERVARSGVALRNLRVCLVTKDETNCGACAKCFRTMVALELLGVRSPMFPPFDQPALGALRLDNWEERYYFEELAEVAHARGRRDLAWLIRFVLLHSHVRERVRPFARRVRGELSAWWRRRARRSP